METVRAVLPLPTGTLTVALIRLKMDEI